MNVAIIVAAGQGTRAAAGGATRKQFRELAGVPVLVHTLRRFDEAGEIGETVAVVPGPEVDAVLALAREHNIAKLTRAVAGGASRAESVWLGLRTIGDAEIVAVHDGVRPFVSAAEIDAMVRAAAATGAAILVAPVTDTVKEIEGGRVARTISREGLRRALTPQCFRRELLLRAYELADAAARLGATDCSALVERLGVEIRVVEGDSHNIKLTRPEDFALAEILMQRSEVRG